MRLRRSSFSTISRVSSGTNRLYPQMGLSRGYQRPSWTPIVLELILRFYPMSVEISRFDSLHTVKLSSIAPPRLEFEFKIAINSNFSTNATTLPQIHDNGWVRSHPNILFLRTFQYLFSVSFLVLGNTITKITVNTEHPWTFDEATIVTFFFMNFHWVFDWESSSG